MKKFVPLLLFSLLCWVARAQSPVVPNNIYFADMHLQIKDDARADIQKIVNALTKHQGYFQRKVDLADAYFPFIEQAFAQEGVPTDFKYLALQESGLTSDAVSTSNAVGFWQFKEGSATDVGIRVNTLVDERKHIVESSRGAAKYLLRNNQYYQNWFNALLSYYQGLTGTKALTKTSDIGAKKMVVDGSTNKYLLTFLAHKIAYENAIGKNPNPPLALQLVKATPGQTLIEIAMQVQADAAEVESYNKWLMASTIPADKEYLVLVPVKGGATRAAAVAQAGPVQKPAVTAKEIKETKEEIKVIAANRRMQTTKVNGLKAVVAQPGDNKDILALQAKMSTRKFLRINDLRSFDPIVPGQTYYLQAKKTKAEVDYHIARSGETLFDLSQKYGVKLSKLRSKNRMKKTEALVPGRVVWLQHTRPKTTPIEIRYIEEEFETESQEILAQEAPAAIQPKQPPVATKEATPAPQPVATVSPATAAPAPSADPVKSTKNTVAAVEVETVDSTVSETPEVDSTNAVATSPAIYPSKNTAGQTKPAVSSLPKAPDEPLVVEIKPTAAAPAKPAKAEIATVHKVEKGETLYTISKLHNVPMEDLVAWNHLDVDAPLALGQELNLTGAKKTAHSVPTIASKPAAEKGAIASTTEHTVAPGETLYSISRKYKISLTDLQNWNNLGASGAISPGQKLAITAPAQASAAEAQPEKVASVAPAASKKATGVVMHKVAPGESMYLISRKYGVTIKEIMEWNNKPDFNVTVGESLVVKPKL